MRRITLVIMFLAAVFCLGGCGTDTHAGKEVTNAPIDEKPVIYLYPQEKTKITVKLELSGDMTTAYPAYRDGWTVIADTDGTLTDEQGMEYSYLYWEGNSDMACDFSKGFCIRGADTAHFLEGVLSEMGLTRREANEFIVYWLPKMEKNEFNVISFQGKNYSDSARLTVTPKPDAVIRVNMAWYGTEQPVTIEPQTFDQTARNGFTVVEWGGRECKP